MGNSQEIRADSAAADVRIDDVSRPGSGLAPQPVRRHFKEIELVRAVAILSVILLHSASPVLYRYGAIAPGVWLTHCVVDAAVRFCVPLFFMASGFLLLSPVAKAEDRPFRELGRRLLRIGAPLVAWSIFYPLATGNGQPISPSVIWQAFLRVFEGAAVYHLWFLYELAVLYVLIPVFRALFTNGTRAGSYFVGVWLAWAAMKLVTQLAGYPNWISNFVVLGNSGYLVAGFLIRQLYSVPSRKLTLSAAFVYVVSTAAIVLMTLRASEKAGAFSEQFFVYSTFPVIAQSIGMFIVLIKLAHFLNASSLTMRSISTFAGVSFGVYFVHVLFLERVGYNVVGSPSGSAVDALSAIISTAAYATVLSWLVAWALSLVRPTRWLVS